MSAQQGIPSAAPKRFLPVRGLILVGMISLLLGVCSVLYASHSLVPEAYRLLAAAFVIAGIGAFARIPQQRRVIREARTRIENQKT